MSPQSAATRLELIPAEAEKALGRENLTILATITLWPDFQLAPAIQERCTSLMQVYLEFYILWTLSYLGQQPKLTPYQDRWYITINAPELNDFFDFLSRKELPPEPIEQPVPPTKPPRTDLLLPEPKEDWVPFDEDEEDLFDEDIAKLFL